MKPFLEGLFQGLASLGLDDDIRPHTFDCLWIHTCFRADNHTRFLGAFWKEETSNRRLKKTLSMHLKGLREKGWGLFWEKNNFTDVIIL